MPFDFPNNPAVNDTYGAYVWTGVVWDKQAGPAGGGGGGGALPVGGSEGQALVLDALLIPTWGAPIDGGNF